VQTVDTVVIPRIMFDMLLAYLPSEVRSNLVALGLNSLHGGVESLTSFFKVADPADISKAIAAAKPAGATIVPKSRKARAAKPKPAKAPKAVTPKQVTKPVSAAPKGKGAKRDPGMLADLTDRLGQYITANPGQRIEQISNGIGVPTKELSLPVRKLLSSGTITKQKEKRATEYYGPKASKKHANGLATTAAE